MYAISVTSIERNFNGEGKFAGKDKERVRRSTRIQGLYYDIILSTENNTCNIPLIQWDWSTNGQVITEADVEINRATSMLKCIIFSTYAKSDLLSHGFFLQM